MRSYTALSSHLTTKKKIKKEPARVRAIGCVTTGRRCGVTAEHEEVKQHCISNK